MKPYLLPLFALALLVPAIPTLAEDDSKERPHFYQNAIERAELRKDQLENRDALFRENMNERKDLHETNKDEREAFEGTHEERKALFLENQAERRALFSENKDERHDLLKDGLGERRTLLKEQWEEREDWFASSSEKWKERFGEKVADRADHLATLFGRMLERLSGIADRIEGRIAELEAEGVDASEAADLLNEADTKIADAADAVDTFIEAVEEALTKENPQEAFAQLKELKDAAKTALREAHQALKEAAAALPKPEKE